MILASFATSPHPFKSNGNKAEAGSGEGTTLQVFGWSFPALPLG